MTALVLLSRPGLFHCGHVGDGEGDDLADGLDIVEFQTLEIFRGNILDVASVLLRQNNIGYAGTLSIFII